MKFVALFKKLILTSLLIIFLMVSLFFPKGVQAQVIMTDPPHLLMQGGKWVAEKTWNLLKLAWEYGGATAYKNTINFYLGEIAKQTAEYVATGGQGQKPMFMTDPNYWSKLGDQALGEWIDQTAKSFTGFSGRSLCDPIDPTIRFNMLVGLDPKYKEMKFDAQLRCSWTTLKKRYKELSKKKLFEFSAELKEGRAGRYRGMLAAQVQGEPSLVGPTKEKILQHIENLKESDEVFRQNVEDLKKIAEGAKKVSAVVMEEIRKGLEKNRQEAEEQKKAFKESRVGKGVICSAKSADDFCQDAVCRGLCSETYTEEQCKSNFGYCTEAAKKTAEFFKRTEDWSNELIDGVGGILKNFADFKPTPPPTLEDTNKQYNPEASDVAVMFNAQSDLFAKQAEAIGKSKFMQGLQGDINRLTTDISELTLTPASGIRKTYEEAIEGGSTSPVAYTGVAVADALGIFTNTLMSKLLQQVFEKGMHPGVTPEIAERTTPFLGDFEEFLHPTQEESEVLYADLAVVEVKGGREVSIYDEFAVCPKDPKYALPTNCLMDNKLVRAIEEKLTIDEAMEKGLLNPSQLVGVSGDYDSLLSWPNIKKLRRIRIFPLGLEIAADKLFHRSLGNIQYSLKQIVDDFHKNGDDDICGTDDNGESPFCHLVDPSWVLKASTYQCEAMGYSAVPMPGSTQRQETCTDLKDCIHEDENGGCDTWAYCVREKNIWRMGGNPCDEQYATCRTYQRAEDKAQFSYLTNTLNFSNCDQNNAGCQWYCSHWGADLSDLGAWACVQPGTSRQFVHEVTCSLDYCATTGGCLCTVCDGGSNHEGSCATDTDCPGGVCSSKGCLVPESGTLTSCTFPVYTEYTPVFQNTIFFNNQVSKCSHEVEGCHEYIRTAPGLGTNLIFNGSFEVSEDGTVPDGWNGTGSLTQGEGIAGSEAILARIDDSYFYQPVSVQKNTNYSVSVYVKKNSGADGDARIMIDGCVDENGADGGITSPDDSMTLQNDTTDMAPWDEANVSLSVAELSEDSYVKFKGTFNSGNSVVCHVVSVGANYGSDPHYFDNVQLETGEFTSSYQGYGEVNKVYLRTAPDYLKDTTEWQNCYDDDPLNNIPECNDYIFECQPKDVGCELYTPTNIDPAVPGIVRKQDQCPGSCLGYESFQEMSSNFDVNSRWVNLIPSTSQICLAPGCEEFTNLESEALEYYTYLRTCAKLPDEADACKYYYTWIGSETTGYQLKRYYLKKASQQYAGDPDANGPMKVSLSPNPEWGECSDADDALSNPHCKQFYDADGNIYYRLYKNTITCSEDCHPYRRTIDQEISMAIPSEGETCSQIDAGCREYKGPAAGNIRQVFWDDFEDFDIGETAIGSWVDGIISAESVNFPGRSMDVDSGSISRSVAGAVNENGTYLLLFWIKGVSSIEAEFTSAGSISKTDLNFNEWQEVRLGPFYFDQSPASDEELTIGSTTSFYIDNILLKEVQDDLYLIKDSWFTSEVCDQDENGNSSPGYMVGCQAYQDRSGQPHYLKSFSYLCSEKMVGCEALIDTQNSLWPDTETFNSGGDSEDDVIVLADELVYLVNNPDKDCQSENKGCQKFGLPTLDNDKNVVSWSDVYFLNDPDLYTKTPTLCLKHDLGCKEYEQGPYSYFKDPGERVCEYRENVAIGYEEHKTGWFKKHTDQACYYESDGTTPYSLDGITYGIRTNDDPDYDPINHDWVGLCPGFQSGCTRFIDPLGENLVANSGFEIDEDVDGVPDEWEPYSDSTTFSLESVDCLSGNCWKAGRSSAGTSAGTQYIRVQPGSTYILSVWVKITGDIGIVNRIYLNYVDSKPSSTWLATANSQQDGSTDGKWVKHTVILEAPSNALYARILAPYLIYNTSTMPAEVLIDNVKLIEVNSNKGNYYYLDNEKLDKSSCQYRAGLKEGCVLFNDTFQSEQTLIYDSALSYAASQANNDLLVSAAITEGGQGDANIVLKVRRDRVCAEWLSCIGSRVVWDPTTGSPRQECEFVGRCDKLIGSGASSSCGHLIYQIEPQVLSESLYQERDVSWAGRDYSGYSLYNKYPVERLYAEEVPEGSGIYKVTFDDPDTPDIEEGVDGNETRIDKTCWIYPEKDSPFSSIVGGEGHKYPDVNICDDPNPSTGLYPDCQCSYVKAEYSGITKYYNKDSSPPAGFCVGYDAGTTKTLCEDSDGHWMIKTKQTQVLGARGWCLEKDESKPDEVNACITWWLGSSLGDPDIQHQYTEAGRAPDQDMYYCLYTENRKTLEDDFYCTSSNDGSNCDQIAYIPSDTLLKPAASGYPYGSPFGNKRGVSQLPGLVITATTNGTDLIYKTSKYAIQGDFPAVVGASVLENYYTYYKIFDWQPFDTGTNWHYMGKSGAKCEYSHSNAPRDGEWEDDGLPSGLQALHNDHWGDDCQNSLGFVAGRKTCPSAPEYERWCWFDDCGDSGWDACMGACYGDEWKTATYCYLAPENKGYLHNDIPSCPIGSGLCTLSGNDCTGTIICDQLGNLADCQQGGCTWQQGCILVNCSDYSGDECTNRGCTWTDPNCTNLAGPTACTDAADEDACYALGDCFWDSTTGPCGGSGFDCEDFIASGYYTDLTPPYAQYCQQLAKGLVDGILATNSYYQWAEKDHSYNSDLLVCRDGSNANLGGTKRCGYKYHWDDGGGGQESICEEFSEAKVGSLDERVPVGPDYACDVVVGANDFFSCGEDCQFNSGELASAGAEKLDDLFIKFDIWDWGTSYAYDNTWNTTCSETTGNPPCVLRADHISPQIASVQCAAANVCEKLRDNQVTVNNRDDETTIRPQTYPAILRFYAWADGDHMPIRNITVDWSGWGETGWSVGEGVGMKAKNHKDACTGTNFGDSSDACVEDYFQFSYIYRCSGSASPGYGEFTSEDSRCSTACCFKPTVYVKDNWGWCDNDCYVGINPTDKCEDSCAGVPYAGLFIITP
ncbi:hypothetical protein ISS21_00220 [Patescibacteria group bacterium]|nr:hypothetical protein [Patescibacteria group bacterium]